MFGRKMKLKYASNITSHPLTVPERRLKDVAGKKVLADTLVQRSHCFAGEGILASHHPGCL